jgi:hypothetical protein
MLGMQRMGKCKQREPIMQAGKHMGKWIFLQI